MKKIILLIILFLSEGSLAGSQTGKVKNILVRDDGLHYVVIDGIATGKPPCATIGYWIIKDENSVYGKSQLSLLMMAFAAQKSVQIEGKNSCTRWDDGEDISAIIIRD